MLYCHTVLSFSCGLERKGKRAEIWGDWTAGQPVCILYHFERFLKSFFSSLVTLSLLLEYLIYFNWGKVLYFPIWPFNHFSWMQKLHWAHHARAPHPMGYTIHTWTTHTAIIACTTRWYVIHMHEWNKRNWMDVASLMLGGSNITPKLQKHMHSVVSAGIFTEYCI